jgi:hypothetical protein
MTRKTFAIEIVVNCIFFLKNDFPPKKTVLDSEEVEVAKNVNNFFSRNRKLWKKIGIEIGFRLQNDAGALPANTIPGKFFFLSWKTTTLYQGCQIFHTKTGKNIANYHKIYKIIITYTKMAVK